MKRVLILLLILAGSQFARATVTVNATLTTPTGPANFAFLQFDLKNCGYNIPVVPNVPSAMVVKSIRFTPAQLPAAIYGDDEITCGNIHSTLWHVTAYADANTPIAGDYDYAICSGTSVAYCPNPSSTSWNLATAQPFSGNPPAPGWNNLYGNPTQNQNWNQPAGTQANMNGEFLFSDGIFAGTVTFSQLSSLTGMSNFVYVSDASPSSSPCTGGGTGAFAFYVNGVWTCAIGSNSGPGGGTVTSVTGTTNQIAVSNSSTTPVISIVANPTLSGNVTVTGNLNVSGASFSVFAQTFTGTVGNTGILPQRGAVSGTAISCFDASGNVTNVGCPPISPTAPGVATEIPFRSSGTGLLVADPSLFYNLLSHTLTVTNINVNGIMTWLNAFGVSSTIPITPACIPAAGMAVLGVNTDGNFATSNNGSPCVDINSSAIPTGIIKGSYLASNGVSANPVYQQKWAVDVRDYGVVGNGSTDDTTALQAAINAACPTAASGGRLIMWNSATGAPLKMKVSSTIKAQKCWNLFWDGGSGEGETGVNTSGLIWAGAAHGTVLLINQTRDSVFQNFFVQTQTGAGANNADIAIDIDEQPTITTITTNDQFRNIWIFSSDSNANFVGFRLGAVATGNVERMWFEGNSVECAGHTATVSNNGTAWLIEGPSGAEPYYTSIHNTDTINCSKGFDVEAGNILDIDGGFGTQNFTDLYVNGGRNVSYRHVRSESIAGATTIVIGNAGSSSGHDLTLEENSFSGLGNNTTTISYPYSNTGGIIRVIKNDWDANTTVTPFGPTGGGVFSGIYDSQDNNYPNATLCPVLTSASRYSFLNDTSASGPLLCTPGMILGGGGAAFALKSNVAASSQSSPSPPLTLQGANFSGGVSNVDSVIFNLIPFAPTPTKSYFAFSHLSAISTLGISLPPVLGGTSFAALTTPVLDGIVVSGTGGAATWTYKIVANDGNGGHTVASAASSTTTGNATLSGTNCNLVEWRPREAAYNYTVYRTASGGTPSSTGIIGTVWPSQDTTTGYFFSDCGLAGDSSTAPVTNTTGNVVIGGALSVTGTGRVSNLGTSGNPYLIYCGTTGTCSNTQLLNGFEPFGTVPLTAGTFAVSGLPFASTTWLCDTWDITTPGTASSMVQVTDSTHATVTGTGTDVIGFFCKGN